MGALESGREKKRQDVYCVGVGNSFEGGKGEMRMPKVGDRAWQVDWCCDGDDDLVDASYRCEVYRLKESAVKRAMIVLPQAIDAVTIREVTYLPYEHIDADQFPNVGFWQPSGETIIVE